MPRRRPNAALPLTDPDPAATARMEAFDALAPLLRRALAECEFDFPSLRVREYQLGNGVAAALAKVAKSVVVERRRYARERDDALAWAAARLFRPRRRL